MSISLLNNQDYNIPGFNITATSAPTTSAPVASVAAEPEATIDIQDKAIISDGKPADKPCPKRQDVVDVVMGKTEGVDSTSETETLTPAQKILRNMDEIRAKLKTEPGKAFFWSGMGLAGPTKSVEVASKLGGVTLEMMLEKAGIEMPEWNFEDAEGIQAWNAVSDAFAEQVSGDVRAVIGDQMRPGSIWETTELPRLKNNPNVTSITVVNPDTGEEKVIFTREKK